MITGLKVYVAGPLHTGASSHDEVHINISTAVLVAEKLLAIGYVPYIPHLTHYWASHHIEDSRLVQAWIAYDLAWLEVCDLMVRIPGESHRADKEQQFCDLHGIQYFKFLTLKSLDDWISSHPGGRVI